MNVRGGKEQTFFPASDVLTPLRGTGEGEDVRRYGC